MVAESGCQATESKVPPHEGGRPISTVVDPVDIGRYWSILVDIGQYWSILVDIGRFWSISVDIGRYRSIKADFG